MELILNLDFVTTEFELSGLRKDSLGFDNESKSLDMYDLSIVLRIYIEKVIAVN
jgi:hypothetical protein